MTTTTAFDEVYAAITRDYLVVTAVDVYLARQLAEYMLADERNTAEVLRLRGALTAKPAVAPFDLGRLDDAELTVMGRLVQKAVGDRETGCRFSRRCVALSCLVSRLPGRRICRPHPH